MGLQRASLLDHILTNREEYYYDGNGLEVGLSDHSLVYVSRKKKKLSKTIQRLKCRNYRRFDEQAFRNHIEHTDWSDDTNSLDADIAAQLFHDMFTSIADVYAPLKTINLKENAPAWINGDKTPL